LNSIKEKLTDYMDSWAKNDRFSGTVLVCKKGDVLLQRGYGYSNHQYKIKNTVSTKYKIGSYTKQFTAVSILKLYEDGKLDIDDNISKYVPEYIYSEYITIHHLLSHTSGIPEHTNFEEYSTREKIKPDIILDRLNKRTLGFNPGDRAEYSNSNYVLLARIVEIVSGLDIETFYQRHIFNPVGLENTGVSRNEDIIQDLAQGYSYSGQGVINADYYDMSGAYGSGFLYSNADDLLRWIQSLFSDKVIKSDTLKKMLTPVKHIWYMDAWSGYGCFVKDDPASEMCASGLISGYVFNIWVDIQSDCVVILLSNNDTNALARMLKGIKGILLGEDSPIEIKPVIKKYIENHDIYNYLVGHYRCQYTGGEFSISLKDKEIYVDRLWVQEYKGQKFKLGYVEETSEQITLACEVCDGKFVFTKNLDGSIKDVLYTYDIFSLPYNKAEE